MAFVFIEVVEAVLKRQWFCGNYREAFISSVVAIVFNCLSARMQFCGGFSSTVLQRLSSRVPQSGFRRFIFHFQALLDNNPTLLFSSVSKRYISGCLQAVISGAEPVSFKHSSMVLYELYSTSH